MQFAGEFKIEKADEARRIVRGWAVVSTIKGERYVDTQGHHIPTGPLFDAAVKFMRSSRASDDMHSEVVKGTVVESVVIDDAWCEANGVPQMEKRGWWVGIQLDEATFQKYLKGEYTGFSIGGWLVRGKEMSKGASAEVKEGAFFAKAAVSIQKSEEPIEFVEFDVDFVSTVDYPAQEPAKAMLLVKARKPDATRGNSLTIRNSAGTPTRMDPEKQIEALKKRQEQVNRLSPEQFAYYKGLAVDDQEDFLAKSNADRDTEVKKALDADPVVHTAPDGTEYRKSAGVAVIELVKSNEKLTKALAEQASITKMTLFKARVANEIPLLKGSDVAKVALLEAVESIGNEGLRKEVGELLKGANEAMELVGKSVGHGLTPEDKDNIAKGGETAHGKFTKGYKKYAKENNLSELTAMAAYAKTDEGGAEWDAVEKERHANAQRSSSGGLSH